MRIVTCIATCLLAGILAAGCAGKLRQPHFSEICGANPVDAAIAAWDGAYPDDTRSKLDAYEACLARVYKARTGEDIDVLMDRLYPDGY